MYKLKRFIKKLFTPVTIMFIPHTSSRHFSFKIPSIGILVSSVAGISLTLYLLSIAIDSFEYRRMKNKLDYYKSQFTELKTTIFALKKTEQEFKILFSLGSKEKILESYDSSEKGSIDMEALKEEVKTTVTAVGDIRDYLSRQKDIYMSTPTGWPVSGRLTSGFGKRLHPLNGTMELHTGMDISADAGSPVYATADGIARYAGWSGGNGNLVVIEHGFGYTTCYAHNKTIIVKTGQVVKRGDVVAHVGSTGSTTGPHLHYEVWKNARAVDPVQFIEGRKW
jgi:murein DD-endopeptidase MepM/ murein hydrolase activator NlpD